MPQVFNPGHRPSSPLEPDELVYCTVDEVADFLQLPLPDPITLSADTTITTGKINIPISGAEYRRWKIDSNTSITVYDDDDPIGKTYTVIDAVSGGSGNVNIRATESSASFTTAKNAQLQINQALTNSKERGLTRSHVENLIRKKQDYIKCAVWLGVLESSLTNTRTSPHSNRTDADITRTMWERSI